MTTLIRPFQSIAADVDSAVATLVAAFASDPVARWIYPDSEPYFTHFPDFIRAFSGSAFADQTVETLEGEVGVAVWLSPTGQPDEEKLCDLLQRTLSKERFLEVFSLIEMMGRYHPAEPHWYLPLIGVDPDRQSEGLGSVLLAKNLARCDRERLPVYLESSNPRNLSLYERFGFRPIGQIRSGTSPTITPMLRDAR